MADKVNSKYGEWAFIWSEVKKRFPDAQYEIIKFDGLPYVYDDKTGFMVYTTVTINGITHEMWFPVMDGKNRVLFDHSYEVHTKCNSFIVKPATMLDVSKAIMRCLAMNLEMFGLETDMCDGENSEEEISKPEPPKASEEKTTANEQSQSDKEKARKKYQELIVYCKENNHDIKAVAKKYLLNAKSSAQDFDTAMRRLIFNDTKKENKSCSNENVEV